MEGLAILYIKAVYTIHGRRWAVLEEYFFSCKSSTEKVVLVTQFWMKWTWAIKLAVLLPGA